MVVGVGITKNILPLLEKGYCGGDGGDIVVVILVMAVEMVVILWWQW